jgi:hypothetical protein
LTAADGPRDLALRQPGCGTPANSRDEERARLAMQLSALPCSSAQLIDERLSLDIDIHVPIVRAIGALRQRWRVTSTTTSLVEASPPW